MTTKDLRSTLIKLTKVENVPKDNIVELLEANLEVYSGRMFFKPGEWEDLGLCQHIAEKFDLIKYVCLFGALMEKGQRLDQSDDDYIIL